MLPGRAAPKAPAEPPCLRLAAGRSAPPPPIGQKPASGATFGVHPPTVPCERGQPAEPSEQRGKALPAPPLRWKETRPAPAATGARLSGCCCHRRCQPRNDRPGLHWLNKRVGGAARAGPRLPSAAQHPRQGARPGGAAAGPGAVVPRASEEGFWLRVCPRARRRGYGWKRGGVRGRNRKKIIIILKKQQNTPQANKQTKIRKTF